jgi:hypothetical protein
MQIAKRPAERVVMLPDFVQRPHFTHRFLPEPALHRAL